MHDILDLDRYPIDRPDSPAYAELLDRCRADLARNGMFNLVGFLRADACATATDALLPDMATRSFRHARSHNIYFARDLPGLAADHPALARLETVNHTLCGDQLPADPLIRIYEYPALIRFLAQAMGLPVLHVMDDPMARLNVMAYRDGEALNWHFDRSEFTTTLLLQAPDEGGEFEYRTDLRSPTDPNYDGVARLLTQGDPEARILRLSPGTLNVFRGKNTAHRVTPVRGDRERVIAVFSYYERPGVTFSDEERVGFYGRAS